MPPCYPPIVKFSTKILFHLLSFFIFSIICFVFLQFFFFTWTWFSHDVTYASHSDLVFIFVLFFSLFELFEHGYNNFESFVVMIFQVIFIAMGVLIVGGDMLSWVFILSALTFANMGGLGWWSRDYFHLNQELGNLWECGRGVKRSVTPYLSTLQAGWTGKGGSIHYLWPSKPSPIRNGS